MHSPKITSTTYFINGLSVRTISNKLWLDLTYIFLTTSTSCTYCCWFETDLPRATCIAKSKLIANFLLNFWASSTSLGSITYKYGKTRWICKHVFCPFVVAPNILITGTLAVRSSAAGRWGSPVAGAPCHNGRGGARHGHGTG